MTLSTNQKYGLAAAAVALLAFIGYKVMSKKTTSSGAVTGGGNTQTFNIDTFLNGTWNLKANYKGQVYANDIYVIKDKEIYWNGVKTFSVTGQKYNDTTKMLTWDWTRVNGEVMGTKKLKVDATAKTLIGTEGDNGLTIDMSKI